jgi:Skp family chaperone for outer membrane proteins
MKTIYKAILAPAVISLALVACNNSKHTEETPGADSTATDSTAGTTGNYSSIKNDVTTAKNDAKTDWSRRMDEIDRDMEELDTKIESEKGETKTELKKRKEELKEESKGLRSKLDRVGEVTDEQWDAFKSEMDKAFDELGDDVKNFFSKDRSDKNNTDNTNGTQK